MVRQTQILIVLLILSLAWEGRQNLVAAGRMGNWQAIAGAQEPRVPTPVEEYRAAAQRGGDIASGKKMFTDNQGACSSCHSVEGKGGKVGPDLLGIADKLDRDGLIRALLEPSVDILPGYETTVVATKNGLLLSGVLKYTTHRQVDLALPDGTTKRVDRDDIDELVVLRKSLMPDNLHAQWTPAQFADLIAYLETLRLPPSSAAARPDNPDTIARAAKPLRLVPIVTQALGIERPVWYGPMSGFPGAYLLVEIERAKIWRIEFGQGGPRKTLFLDLYDQTRHGYIEGILGFALHPDFAKNGRYYLAMHDPARDQVIVNVWERRASKEGIDDPTFSPLKLMGVPMPHVNHNGCCLEFGPDGFLYISFGDGGPQEDPDGHSQSHLSMLGKILCIDVNRSMAGKHYAIPETNPFRLREGYRREVWALGFREPWRFTFDRKTGELWVGDVGQNRFEEVAVVKRGENHGWNVMEGFEPFSAAHRRLGRVFVPPVLSYNRRHGVSVTGGYVYRGTKAPALEGFYIFGDYESRKIWGLLRKNGVLASLVELGRSPSRIAAFGENTDGELFLVGQDPAAIYRMDLSTVDPSPVTVRELAPTSEKAGILWRHTLTEPADGWTSASFDDKAWRMSPGGFGSPGTPGAIVRTEWRTADIWLRREFTLTEANLKELDPANCVLRIHHDEDAEVYLNGVLAARPRGFTSGYTDMPLDAAAIKALRAGSNLLAIHCHQVAGGQYIDAGLMVFQPGAVGPAKRP